MTTPELSSSPPAAPPRLPRAVIALGWVSLLTDAASDMIYPLVPRFLITLGGGPEALGWFDGIAEAVAAVLKLYSGKASDHAARRKPLIALGYGVSTLSRPLLAVASQPFHAVLIRALDRVGKGLRGPPRDAMVAGAVPAAYRGMAFGFHRMMDNLGGVLGPITAAVLIHFLDLPLRRIFALSVIPGVLAVLVVLLFVREPPPAAEPLPDPVPAEAPKGTFPPAARRYFAALAVFSLAGSGDLFLVRRLGDLGLDDALIPIAWVSLQLGKSLLNIPGGRASDRFGRRRVLSFAWVLYAATYAGLGLCHSWPAAWALFAVYALYYGLAEGGERALLAECVPKEALGRAYGVRLAIEGAMVLPANVLFGMAYARLGVEVAFVSAGGLALLGAALLAGVSTRRQG